MMIMRGVLLCCSLLMLATQTGWPGQVLAPAGKLSWQEYPDVETLTQPETIAAMFPDYDPGALLSAGYGEYQPYYQPPLGLVTCTSRRDAYLALIHYGGGGNAWVHAAGLPLPVDHETTLSYKIDADDPGLSRLLLWSNPPTESWLLMLAQHPNWTAEPVPGVLAQRWFTGGQGSVFTPPWDDPWRPQYNKLAQRTTGGQLLSWARPTPAGTVQAKDCAVLFTGTMSTGFDDYGFRAYWELDWAAELDLIMVLPPHLEGVQAELFLFADEAVGSMFLAEPDLAITVNGWLLDEMDIVPFFREPGEPTIVSLSRYTVSGENRIGLGNHSLAGSSWRLSEIEVWTY